MKLSARLLVTFIAIVTILGLTACGGEEGQKPLNPFVAPELNTTFESTMQRRTRGEPDNYQETCTFLNESFERYNTCSVSVQTGLDLDGKQVTDQEAIFTRLEKGSTFSTFSLDDGFTPEDKDRLTPSQYEVGDIIHLYKKDSDVEYEMVFEIIEENDNSVKIEYQITTFRHLW